MTIDLALPDIPQYGGTSHPNPAFDYLTAFVPRKLKDLFKWAEFLAYNSAHIYAIVRKFGELPITTFTYDTQSPSEKARHKKLFEHDIRLKGHVCLASFDKNIYGNAFSSVIEPFKRWLICKNCKTQEDCRSAEWSYNSDRVEFKLTCKNCKSVGVADIKDTKLPDPTKISLTRWDPKLMDINHNPVTGEAEYFYEIPRSVIDEVRSGNRLLISTLPRSFLNTIQARKPFKFGEDQIYHMRVPGPAGTASAWGFPPLTSALKLFLFAATLRRANEAIALEYITPFRVLHPLSGGPSADPYAGADLGEWRDRIMSEYKQWRRDPLRMMTSPIPVGVQNVGGDGRALLTLGELQEAEKNIALAMGVPLEFLTGGLGQTRGEITLRMVENQLQTHIEDLNGLVQWIERRCASFLGWSTVPTKLADFKLIDDAENKQVYLQLWQSGKLSDTKIGEVLGIDWVQERKQISEDTLANLKMQLDLQAEQRKLENSLSQQAINQAQMQQGGANYDPQKIMEEAKQLAQEYSGLDAGTVRSRMDALKLEDGVMYSCVRTAMEQMQQDEDQAAKAQSRAGG